MNASLGSADGLNSVVDVFGKCSDAYGSQFGLCETLALVVSVGWARLHLPLDGRTLWSGPSTLGCAEGGPGCARMQ